MASLLEFIAVVQMASGGLDRQDDIDVASLCGRSVADHSRIQLPRLLGVYGALTQQVQRCITMLPAAASSSSGSGLHKAQGVAERTAKWVVHVQLRMAQQAVRGTQLLQGQLLQQHNAWVATSGLAETSLQLLCSYTRLLHHKHLAMQPELLQRRQQEAVKCSGKVSTVRQPVQAALLPIPPVHERLKLLPTGAKQLHVQAIRSAALAQGGSLAPGGKGSGLRDVLAHTLMWADMQSAVDALTVHLRAVCMMDKLKQQQGSASSSSSNTVAAAAAATAATVPAPHSPALTAPAVVLVIEALLLLAADIERSAGSQKANHQQRDLFNHSNELLQKQLTMLSGHSSDSYRITRSMVVRRSGQQLLQLVRWNIQHDTSQFAAGSKQRLDVAITSQLGLLTSFGVGNLLGANSELDTLTSCLHSVADLTAVPPGETPGPQCTRCALVTLATVTTGHRIMLSTGDGHQSTMGVLWQPVTYHACMIQLIINS